MNKLTKLAKPPALPPKKIAPDPDYEIIEFGNEQYSNAQPIKCSSMTKSYKMLRNEYYYFR